VVEPCSDWSTNGRGGPLNNGPDSRWGSTRYQGSCGKGIRSDGGGGQNGYLHPVRDRPPRPRVHHMSQHLPAQPDYRNGISGRGEAGIADEDLLP
jgi:hypothetical protein